MYYNADYLYSSSRKKPSFSMVLGKHWKCYGHNDEINGKILTTVT